MKNVYLLSVCALVVLIYSCKKDVEDPNPPVETHGLLSMEFATWNSFQKTSGKQNTEKENEPITLELLDVRTFKYSIALTTDEIYAGLDAADITWTEVYTSDEYLLDSERNFSFSLPAGDYKGFKLIQADSMRWVCNYNDGIIEIKTFNKGDESFVYDEVLNIFGEDGLYDVDGEGKLYRVLNDEKLGLIKIEPGGYTNIISRLNIMTVDWYDVNNNGIFDGLDSLKNWTLPEGITTMNDFIVTYQ